MKFIQKNIPQLLLLLFLGLIVGTLCWAVIEKIINSTGTLLDLSIGPIGFNVNVISFYFKVNPGSIIGLFTGILLFRKLK